MMRLLAAYACGLLFALGLGISGMTQPEKVLGFLDLFGTWDPSLALVMAGAVGVNFVLYRLTSRRPRPVLEREFVIPSRRRINGRLVGGAALFGIGWGLAGYCPGPAVAAAGGGMLPAAVFLLAMLAGMWLFLKVPGEEPRPESPGAHTGTTGDSGAAAAVTQESSRS